MEVKNLVKKFGNFTAVREINFEVYRGEIFGFLGPNGAGKSTTMQILATLLRPTAGTAIVNEYDIVEDPDRVRQSIGMVFQDPSLDERLTARENLYFHAVLYNKSRQVMKHRMKEVLEIVGLEERQNDLVKTFSGGMRRRLEIARGLLHYPLVLFLDEPTVGLDPQTRKRIWEYINYLQDKEDLTIFLTTHYMDEAENCHRIAVMDHGEIVARDTPRNLKKMVDKDAVIISTEDNDRAAQLIESELNLGPERQGDKIKIHVENGEEFLPRLVHTLEGTIKSLTINKPSLDDVFLHLTGKEIREENASAVERSRMYSRRHH